MLTVQKREKRKISEQRTMPLLSKKKAREATITKNEFDLQEGNVDNFLKFDDIFQNLRHWNIDDMFSNSLQFGLHYMVQFSEIQDSSCDFSEHRHVEVCSGFVLRVRFDRDVNFS